jgi:small subunit ribosomal protein S1
MANHVDNPTEETQNNDSPVAEQNDQQTGAAAAASTEAPNAQQQSAAEAEEHQNEGMDFGAILQQFEQEQTIYHSGELVDGKVVGISDRGVLVDFGYKSEGVVPVEDFTGPDGEMTVKVGDPVQVVIRTIHTGDAPPQLSRADAIARQAWTELEQAYKEERPVVGRIVDKTKGGLKVDLHGIEAFLPGSQIDSRPAKNLDSYLGQDIEAKIIKFSRRRNNVVLSRKVITDEVVNAQKAETLTHIDIGFVVEGTIKNLTEYGAFVDIGGIDGLLHVTDMSWGRLHHPSDQFKVGDNVQVKVLKLDRDKEKVSLGYKQLLPDPWSTVMEVYPINARVKGRVTSVTDYGVFVELEPGVEGLVHVSEISWSKRAPNPKKMFNKGDEVDVQVLGVDTVDKRISLGMKQFQENPWETVEYRFPVGTKVRGKVRNLTDFGAFVELEEGIDGLVHVSDITWAKKVKHPKELLKKDQEVDAIVTNIDKRGQRLSLSMKDLMPSAWETFVATHRAGDTVRGKVTRFTSFGVFVELADGLEGLCHISELSDERVERPDDVAQIGQEMDFKILRIEYEDQKIGLSHRAVGKDDEPVVDTRMYTSEAKGGMASLAELANLKLGSAAEASTEEAAPGASKKERRAARQAAAQSQSAGEEVAPAEEGEAAVEPAAPEATAEPTGDASAETETAVSEPESTEAQSESADQEAQGGSLTEGEKSPEENSNTEANGAAGE